MNAATLQGRQAKKPSRHSARIGVTAVVGLAMSACVVLYAGAALVGRLPYDPIAQDPLARLSPPSPEHWFGTDQFGRDIFSRAGAGLLTSLIVAAASVAIAAGIGTAIGVLAAQKGGWLATVVGRITDVLFAFPAIILALAIASALGGGSVNVTIAISIVYLPIFMRIAYTSSLSVIASDYMQATNVLDLRRGTVLVKHLLPAMGAAVLVQFVVRLSTAFLTEASLSFLGLGTPPPAPSLGLMVSESRSLFGLAWWTLAIPAFVLTFTIVAINLAGDAGRSVLDPKR